MQDVKAILKDLADAEPYKPTKKLFMERSRKLFKLMLALGLLCMVLPARGVNQWLIRCPAAVAFRHPEYLDRSRTTCAGSVAQYGACVSHKKAGVLPALCVLVVSRRTGVSFDPPDFIRKHDHQRRAISS